MEKTKLVRLSIDKKISALNELIYQLKDNQTIISINEDREALINACNLLDKYNQISNKLHND
jgi:hypothetical protein|tara:strand:- start:109 stop:294 length:186 start_codon:yes stop_codon:yes gene_type:complete